MNIEDCHIVTEWDYEGYKRNNPNFFMQKDWNQTLVTKINQISANIHQASFRGGADTIFINGNMLPIFETMEYFNITNFIMGNRYRVNVRETIPDNHIFITREETFIDTILYPQIDNTGQMPEITLSVRRNDGTDPEVNEYVKKLKACIIVENYEIEEYYDSTIKKGRIKFGF